MARNSRHRWYSVCNHVEIEIGEEMDRVVARFAREEGVDFQEALRLIYSRGFDDAFRAVVAEQNAADEALGAQEGQ